MIIEFTSNKPELSMTLDGAVKVTLTAPKVKLSALNGLAEKKYDVVIKEKRAHRSLDANAYAWLLITAIADVLNADKEEIYLAELKKYGQSEVVSVKSSIMWIDLSIRKHGLFSKANPTGWMVKSYSCPESTLNHFETLFIREYAGKGYQMRNKTSGGQCAGKTGITANKPAKGYYDGVAQGRANVQRELRDMFRVSLDVSIKGKPNKNKEKALRRFMDFIGDEDNG